MKLHFTARAAQDIAEIANYVRAGNPRAVLRVRATILESIALIGSFPGMAGVSRLKACESW